MLLVVEDVLLVVLVELVAVVVLVVLVLVVLVILVVVDEACVQTLFEGEDVPELL